MFDAMAFKSAENPGTATHESIRGCETYETAFPSAPPTLSYTIFSVNTVKVD